VPGTAKTHQVMVEDVENEDMDIMTAKPEPVRSAMTDVRVLLCLIVIVF
jgi:hypothetical protein